MEKINIFIALIIATTLNFSCNKEAELKTDMSEHFYFRNGGSDMPVYVHGNGASNVFILLLHGGPGDGGLKYRNHYFSNSLEEKYAMVYWDQRHQGNSHGHLENSDITIDKMVEDTYYLIQTLKERYGKDISIFLMGHSWGGILGTAFMLKDDYQNTVNGWIESAGAHDFPLINIELIKMIQDIGATEIAAGRNVEKWKEAVDYAKSIDTTNIQLEQTTKLNEYGGICEELTAHLLNPKSQSQLSDFENLFFTADNPAQVILNQAQLPEDFFKEINDFSMTDQLDKITTPTLLLWGKYDFKVPKALGEKAYEKINTPDKYLKIYSKSGHSSMRYEHTLFVQDVVEFVEKYK